MKKIITTLLLTGFLHSFVLHAQTPLDNNITDLLNRVPAANAEQLKTNMELLGKMGEPGLEKLATLLDGADKSKPEYAIKSFSYYTTEPSKEEWRKWSVTAYTNALQKTTNVETKAFLIRQLQVTGKDDAVAILQPYLADERLVDPAARALVKINTASAQKALLDALKNASGNSRNTLIEALGDAQFKEAVPALTALIGADKVQNKLVYFALAHIADPSSLTVLASAAAKAGYTYDVSNATDNYTLYLHNLTAGGQSAIADKAALELLKKSAGDKAVHTRTAALELLTEIRGEKSLPLLLAAMDDKNRQYREAALKFAGKNMNDASVAAWLKKSAISSRQVKAEIFTMLGNKNAVAALPAVTAALKDTSAVVKLAAIRAAGQLGGEKAVPALLLVLKNGKPAEVTAVKDALLTIKGAAVATQSAAALNTASPIAKSALIDVLAARGADNSLTPVIALTKSADTSVSKSSFAALKKLSTPASLPELFPLLLSVNKPVEQMQVQQALIAATSGITDTAKHVSLVAAQMQQAPDDKKALYLPVLAAGGSKEALKTIASSFDKGDAATKTAVIESLSNWRGNAAIEALYTIAQQPANAEYLDASLRGFADAVNRSSFESDEKLLLFRRGMELTKNTAQKQTILREISNCKTLIALIYAGNYLDDAALQQDAAHTVMSIALNDNALSGDTVRALLAKSAALLKGSDSEDQKQAIQKYLDAMPKGDGFVTIFNGKDLTGWKGLVENPIARAKMNKDTLAKYQVKADASMRESWSAKNGELVFAAHGDNLCTEKKYGDFEMYVDWKIQNQGDAGIYLRGTPQVQIWDTSRVDVGAQVGSGGLYNNQTNMAKPLKLADNAIGDWNTFHIIMKGERVTVYLNGELVVNNTILENYWDHKLPIFPSEQIELQAHGTIVAYRDLYIRELPAEKPYVLSDDEKKDGYKLLFDGTNMQEWTGNLTDYSTEGDHIIIKPTNGGHGNLYTKDEYSDFVYRFEFQLTPGANNGIGIRAPLEGDAAYVGMEIQVLDNESDMYKNLHPYQYHGSVYGVIPAKRGYLKPLGEWNVEEITAKGSKIKVVLNGTTILDGDIDEASKNGIMDGNQHPGLKNAKGHLGFLGHGDVVSFRHMRVKDLTK